MKVPYFLAGYNRILLQDASTFTVQYAREHVKTLTLQEKSASEIMQSLQQEGICVCRQTVWRFQRHYHHHHCIAPLRRSGRPTKLTECVLQAIESAMQNDDETTAAELGLCLFLCLHAPSLKGEEHLGGHIVGLPIVNLFVR